MFHRWAALVLVLALCAMSPKNAAGQTQSSKPREPGAGKLGRNYPNPFNPATSFTFDVDPDVCTDGSQQHVVTLQIYNLLMVPVAVPVLQVQSTSTTSVPSELVGQPLRNLRLGCGHYIGFWNGNLSNGKEAPSGPFVARLFVDKKLAGTIQIFNGK